MDGWRDILHFDFHGEHVLVSSLPLSSGLNFILASVLTIFLCLLEKALSYALSSGWNPLPSRNSHFGNVLFRTALYWILTLIRLLYMLLAMTFHVGLILVAVTTLSAGQFAIEYFDPSHSHTGHPRNFSDAAPLLGNRYFAHSAEYFDLPTTGTSERMATPGYPQRRTAGGKATESLQVGGPNNGGTIFAVGEGDETA